MMDLYFLEFFIKERQQQILDEFKRIQISKTKHNPEVVFLKNAIIGLSKALITMGTRLQNRYRLSIEPVVNDRDSRST